MKTPMISDRDRLILFIILFVVFAVLFVLQQMFNFSDLVLSILGVVSTLIIHLSVVTCLDRDKEKED